MGPDLTSAAQWLTVVTTGEALCLNTDFGTIEMVHPDMDPLAIVERCVRVPGRPLPLATADLALEDIRRVGRNVNMLSDDD